MFTLLATGRVFAIVNDNEATLKRIYKEKNGFRLQPANKNYKAIYPVHSLNINAVLKAVIRKY